MIAGAREADGEVLRIGGSIAVEADGDPATLAIDNAGIAGTQLQPELAAGRKIKAKWMVLKGLSFEFALGRIAKPRLRGN